jgi:hypothetical protein
MAARAAIPARSETRATRAHCAAGRHEPEDETRYERRAAVVATDLAFAEWVRGRGPIDKMMPGAQGWISGSRQLLGHFHSVTRASSRAGTISATARINRPIPRCPRTTASTSGRCGGTAVARTGLYFRGESYGWRSSAVTTGSSISASDLSLRRRRTPYWPANLSNSAGVNVRW